MPGGDVGPYPNRGSEKFRATQQISAEKGLQPGVWPPRPQLLPWLYPLWKERRPRDQGALPKQLLSICSERWRERKESQCAWPELPLYDR